jgi:hypothetical protein
MSSLKTKEAENGSPTKTPVSNGVPLNVGAARVTTPVKESVNGKVKTVPLDDVGHPQQSANIIAVVAMNDFITGEPQDVPERPPASSIILPMAWKLDDTVRQAAADRNEPRNRRWQKQGGWEVFRQKLSRARTREGFVHR